jgi:hypothetical protein
VLLSTRSIWGHRPTGSFEEDETDGVIYYKHLLKNREIRLEVLKRWERYKPYYWLPRRNNPWQLVLAKYYFPI